MRELRAREGERLRDLMRISGTLRGNEDDNQLLRIRGIGRAKYRRLRAHVKVQGESDLRTLHTPRRN